MSGISVKTNKLLIVAALLSVLTSSLFASLANATTPLSQGYTSDKQLAIGSIVSIENNYQDKVIPSAPSNADNMLGVVVNNNNSVLSLTNGKDNQVQVATSGTIQVLVSDVNGDIKKGDHIAASPILGVGMKATSNSRVVGIAQQGLDANNSKDETYIDKAGNKQTVKIGQISVLVNVVYFFKEPDKTIVPAAIQNLANSLAGRTVSTLPIIISAAIFVVTIVVVASITFSMIRSSIISVGRNPMSQSAIYRDLIQLSVLILAILSVGVISIYLVLTRM